MVAKSHLELINKIKIAIKDTEFEGKTYIAGGFVRDMVMGNTKSKDIDIVVELSNGGIKLAKFLSLKLGGTNAVIFERFGTAQIVVDGFDIEFVMTRKEFYIPGSRKPDTAFGTIEDDVKRRDFTINAMLYDLSNDVIIDLVGGKEDIKNHIIRATSDPQLIFDEDPLRMLRAIRFACRFNFTIDTWTWCCLHDAAPSISNISKERVRDEFLKIMETNNPINGIKLLLGADLMKYILPELHDIAGTYIEQNQYHTKTVFGHILDVIEQAKPTWKHRLAALLHDIGKLNTKTTDASGNIHFYGHEEESEKITRRFLTEYKFSNDEIELITSAVANHMLFIHNPNNKTIRKKRMLLGDESFNFLLDLSEADRKTHIDFDENIFIKVRKMLEEEIPLKKQEALPVNGKMIMELFNLEQGPEVGRILNQEREFLLENPDVSMGDILNFLRNKLNERN